MKNIIFYLVLSIIGIESYSQEKLPNIILKTINQKLNSNDFDTSKIYFITLDTFDNTKNKNNYVTDYREYNNTEEVIFEINKMLTLYNGEKLYNLVDLTDHPWYKPAKYHYGIFFNKNKDQIIYKINWFFSDIEYDKLKGVTLSKYEDKN